MTEEALLDFPPSRVLAGWWKQLTPLRPEAIWVAHLFFHHVEALVEGAAPVKLDGLSASVLQGLGPTPQPLARLQARSQLDAAFLNQVLRQLGRDRLAVEESGQSWRRTPEGEEALRNGQFPRAQCERRGFAFLDPRRQGMAPQFVSLIRPEVLTPWRPDGDWQFDLHALSDCLTSSLEWKKRRNFPAHVRRIFGMNDEPSFPDASSEPWRRVVVDHPGYLFAMLVALPTGANQVTLQAYPIRRDRWELSSSAPAFDLSDQWPEILPELKEEPSPGQWREAWQSWCQPRSLPAADVGACTLRREGCRLNVSAPRRLVERLRAARSDVFKGEAWLTAGGPSVRVVASVDLTTAEHAVV